MSDLSQSGQLLTIYHINW